MPDQELLSQIREIAEEKGLDDVVGYLNGIAAKSEAELQADQSRLDEWLSDPENKARWEAALEAQRA